MDKIFITLLLVLSLTFKMYAQKKLFEGIIITEQKDTIIGKITDKKYYNKSRVKIVVNNQVRTFTKKDIKLIEYSDKVFVKGKMELGGSGFFLKTEFDCLNIYAKKRRNYLGTHACDINSGGIRPSIKYFCGDYTDIKEFRHVKRDSVLHNLLRNYCEWKKTNPQSKSYYEQNYDSRGNINLKISFLIPGIGAEFRLNDYLSFESMLKTELYFGSAGSGANPLWDNQIRYYFDTRKRKIEKRKIHKYTGYYLSAKNSYYLKDNLSLVGLLGGWQYSVNKHGYFNFAGGAGTSMNNGDFYFMINFDYGLNF